MGKKPVPDELKKLRGTAQKCRMNEDKPEFETGLFTPPVMVANSELALREWEIKTAQLNEAGILQGTDDTLLGAYCIAVATMQKARAALDEEGFVLRGKDSGIPYQHPMLAIYNKAVDQVVKLASEFGFSPSSRQRISAPKKGKTNAFSRLRNSDDKLN